MEERYHARRLHARKVNRWKGRFEGLMHELERRHHPIRHDVRDGDIQEALDVAIQDVCLRMTPLSPQEARLPGNERYTTPPLQDDVALALGGRIYGVVRWTPDGPRVHKFFLDSPTR
jgi:hypothetical protein